MSNLLEFVVTYHIIGMLEMKYNYFQEKGLLTSPPGIRDYNDIDRVHGIHPADAIVKFLIDGAENGERSVHAAYTPGSANGVALC